MVTRATAAGWADARRLTGGRGEFRANVARREPPRAVSPKKGLARGDVTVARTGLEPVTFHFSGERYYHLSYLAERSSLASSDPDGTRTRDLRRDRAAR
jgi:hypothetical protein